MKLYHCSPTSGLQVLEPNVTRYFGKPRQVCLAASLPMALFYGVKHFEYTYGYTREGVLYYEEYYPEALAGNLSGTQRISLHLYRRRGYEQDCDPQ